MLYLNFVSVARLERNPTIKEEIHLRGFGRDIPAGFLCYPAAQAADITAFQATVVPVGDDQLPMIEQANELVRRINRQAAREILPEARALVSKTGRLPGVDGKRKMSKSQGNAVSLSASPQEIDAAVQHMFTDPNHLRVSDPGQVEGNVVFAYLDAFDPDEAAVAALKAHYRRGGLGDATLKGRLAAILKETIAPIRDRRAVLASDRNFVMDVLRAGTPDTGHTGQPGPNCSPELARRFCEHSALEVTPREALPGAAANGRRVRYAAASTDKSRHNAAGKLQPFGPGERYRPSFHLASRSLLRGLRL